MLTDASGEKKYSALYDLCNGKLAEEWNPNGLELVGKMRGASINVEFPNSLALAFNQKTLCDIEISAINIYSEINISSGVVNIFKVGDKTEPIGCANSNCDGETCNGLFGHDPNATIFPEIHIATVEMCKKMSCCKKTYDAAISVGNERGLKDDDLLYFYEVTGISLKYPTTEVGFKFGVIKKRINDINAWINFNRDRCKTLGVII